MAHRKAFAWEETLGREFDLMFDEELASFKPDAMLTFGGTAGDIRRRQRARRQGVRVVFGLRNNGYLDAHPEFWESIDEILTPSRFLTDQYRTRQHIESTPIPSPFDINDVIAEDRDPIFFTMVNPSPEKGLMLFARLAEECSKRRPDIPFLVVESRGSGGMLVRVGLAAGFDLRRHENIMLSSAVPQPRDIYLAAKAILAPSFCEESFGRVAAEAMLNGIPPLCSNRGGMTEICSGAGFVLDVPAEYNEHTPHPVAARVVTPWIALIERLEDDAAFLAAESVKAKQAGRRYHPDVLVPRYLDFFAKL